MTTVVELRKSGPCCQGFWHGHQSSSRRVVFALEGLFCEKMPAPRGHCVLFVRGHETPIGLLVSVVALRCTSQLKLERRCSVLQEL